MDAVSSCEGGQMQRPTKHELESKLKSLEERFRNGPPIDECVQKTIQECLDRSAKMLQAAEFLLNEFNSGL